MLDQRREHRPYLQDTETEKALLGALMADPDEIIKVRPIICAGDFTDDAHRVIAKAIYDLHDHGDRADALGVKRSLKKTRSLASVGGAAYLADAIRECPSPVGAVGYARIVAGLAHRRRLIDTLERQTDRLYQGHDTDDVAGVVSQAFDQVTNQGGGPEATPLPDDLPPVAPYTDDLLPGVLRDYVADIADRLQCPPDFAAVATICVLGAALGRRCAIRPRRRDNWTVVPNLWGAVIGKPSVLKTPAIKAPLSLLHGLEASARKDHDVATAAHEREVMLATEKIKAARDAMRKAIKRGASDDEARAMMEQVGGAPAAPPRKRYLTSDATVEKLGEVLAENPAGVLTFRDELVGWLSSLERENQAGARAFYLEAWDGTSRFTYDRIGRGTVEIETAVVSVFGGIQPGRLGPYVRSAVDGGADDDGLMQRFQLVVWPDIPPGWKNVDQWPDITSRNKVAAVVDRFATATPGLMGAETDPFDSARIPFVRFDEAAQVEFDDWRSDLEIRLRSGDDHFAIEAHLGKYRSLIPSLALIFHMSEHYTGPVEVDALRRAIQFGAYLESHAERVYSAAVAAEVNAAKAIWSRVLKGDIPDEFTARDVYIRRWAGLGDAETVKAGLALLVNHNHLIPRDDPKPPGPGRPPATRYATNPRAKLFRRPQSPLTKSTKYPKGNFVDLVSDLPSRSGESEEVGSSNAHVPADDHAQADITEGII